MRTIFLAFVLGGTGFVLACAHEAKTSDATQLTSADITRIAHWEAGAPEEVPGPGWDNSKSEQVREPQESILKNTGSR